MLENSKLVDVSTHLESEEATVTDTAIEIPIIDEIDDDIIAGEVSTGVNE